MIGKTRSGRTIASSLSGLATAKHRVNALAIGIDQDAAIVFGSDNECEPVSVDKRTRLSMQG